MRRGAVAVFTVVAAVAMTTSADGAPATIVKKVSPVDASGALQPRYEVAHSYGGARCQSGSAMTGTAYRCFTSRSPQGVYDPCWVTSSSDRVICLDVPWRRHKVTELHVTSGYDDADGFHHQRWPWGLRPEIHRRCLLHPAAVESAHGRPIHYYCNKHTALAGRLDRSGARWRIHAYRNATPHAVQPTYESLGWVRVVVAWYGEPSRTG